MQASALADRRSQTDQESYHWILSDSIGFAIPSGYTKGRGDIRIGVLDSLR